MSVLQVVSKHLGGVVIQQRVDHAVTRRQTQRHHHGPLQHQRDVTVPAAAHGMQVQRSNHVIGQKREQESCHHHADQVHGVAFLVAGLSAAVEAGAGHQASNESAVANDDCEEREEEAESQCHVV